MFISTSRTWAPPGAIHQGADTDLQWPQLNGSVHVFLFGCFAHGKKSLGSNLTRVQLISGGLETFTGGLQSSKLWFSSSGRNDCFVCNRAIQNRQTEKKWKTVVFTKCFQVGQIFPFLKRGVYVIANILCQPGNLGKLNFLCSVSSTRARDFRPLVFFINRAHFVP
jgi:hypothetical protein